MAYVYGLIDPRSGDIRYIGKANHPAARLKTHMRDAPRRDTPVYRWIRKLVAEGETPEMLVLSECENWQAEERRLIASARARGYSLLNIADGGDQPACPKDVQASNGAKNSRARESDPKLKAIHRYLQRMGYVYSQAKHWSDERRAKNARALEIVKMKAKQDPEAFYRQLVEMGRA